MTTDAPSETSRPTPKAMLWTGRIISAIPVLMMGVLGAVMMIAFPEKAAEGTAKYGYPAGVTRPLFIVEIALGKSPCCAIWSSIFRPFKVDGSIH